jgi:hypothetical protein
MWVVAAGVKGKRMLKQARQTGEVKSVPIIVDTFID